MSGKGGTLKDRIRVIWVGLLDMWHCWGGPSVDTCVAQGTWERNGIHGPQLEVSQRRPLGYRPTASYYMRRPVVDGTEMFPVPERKLESPAQGGHVLPVGNPEETDVQGVMVALTERVGTTA